MSAGLRLVPKPTIRVLLAEGHTLVRAGLRVLLEEAPDVRVVAEAVGGAEAVALSDRLGPDVVLLDVDLDCVATTERICAGGDSAVLLLAGSENDDRIVPALRAGASGVVVRDTEPGELVVAVQLLARGEMLVPPGLTRRLISELVAGPEPIRRNPEQLEELTEREREVMALAARGLSNQEIAEHLVVSPATAKTHISRAMVKVRAHDRAQLVALAYESGLVLART